ncbi:MAG: acetolactate synthase small subunit [Candidatus Melainabacteria bacterium RIFOXYA12_FULL_32_12]|nr:MAG: acetolactate synthase small subunit [Candidatus Melainabacteria bacterium RIFOXYA2_FULL_32_9]OGI28273.1 MAG: acetolactate synthase small subunit [Candidatus Melainabacteria bacterium RIFOXYA12_FULL_32_12]
MRHTLSVLVQNEAGVLARISGLFSGRGFNIESLTVAPTQDVEYSRVTLVTTGDDTIIEQISKQLNKLINVIKVVDITGESSIDREIILVKVTSKDKNRSEILRIAELFDAKIIDISPKAYTLEAMGDESKIKSLLELLKPIGIKELVRSGKVAISREIQLSEKTGK